MVIDMAAIACGVSMGHVGNNPAGGGSLVGSDPHNNMDLAELQLSATIAVMTEYPKCQDSHTYAHLQSADPAGATHSLK